MLSFLRLPTRMGPNGAAYPAGRLQDSGDADALSRRHQPLRRHLDARPVAAVRGAVDLRIPPTFRLLVFREPRVEHLRVFFRAGCAHRVRSAPQARKTDAEME